MAEFAAASDAVQVMGTNVLQDGGRQQLSGAGAVELLAQPLAYAGGARQLMDMLQQMDARSLLGAQSEGIELPQREAGTADHDPLGELQQGIRSLPAAEIEKGVGADDHQDPVLWHDLPTEPFERIDGIVRGAIREGSIQRRGLKDRSAAASSAARAWLSGRNGRRSLRLGGAQQGYHRQTVCKACGGSVWLERLPGHRGQENRIQMEGRGRRAPYCKMPQMGWIKAATEEANTHDR